MKCDLSVCKAADGDEPAIIFGDLYPLPPEFELSAVSSGVDSDTISINITPLTNIAAALALDKVSNEIDPAAAATLSNFEVARHLGLVGNDVTALPIVDLTDADAINAADADALEANLKSAAIVEAVINDSAPGTSLEEALESFVDQYVTSGGIGTRDGDSEDATILSTEEIAAVSQELLTKAAEFGDIDAEVIAYATSALLTEETAAANGTTEIIVVDIPDDIGSTGLVATKAFVSQVSAFNLAAQLDGDETSFEEEAFDGVNAFKDEISLVSDLASSGLDVNAEALSLAAAAIADAVDAVLDSETPLTTHPYQSESGIITVDISINGDTVTYTVDQTLTVANSIGLPEITTIDLTAILEFSDTIDDSETETETPNGFTWSVDGTASLDLSLSGSVSTDQVSITIDNGSHFIATLTVDEEEAGQYISEGEKYGLETASGLLSVTGVDVELSVIIAQTNDDPISFTGDFNIAASLLSIDYDETEEWENIDSPTGYSESYTNNETEIISVDGLTASLSGIFSNSSNSLEATVALAASGIEETCVWSHERSYSNSDTVEADNYQTNTWSDDCNLDETATTYGSASISVMLTLSIDGIADEIELDASIERTGLESGIASIDLTYNGNQLNFDFNTDNIIETESESGTITTTTEATLTNHNGVILTVTDVEVDYETGSELSDTFETTGSISHEGEVFATVSDDGIVTFSDGTFVTL
ncbi:MAG: hypothetical protein JKX76_07980 [Colwellia sp.]|nr:hypothetical protein [Colwellia sp.]